MPPSHCPLSAYQRVLWSWERRHPGTPTLHALGGPRIVGRLDRDALSAAIDHVFSRHDAMRMRIALTADTPTQHFPPHPRPILERERFADGPRVRRRADAYTFARTQAERPFELVGGQLVRIMLLELFEDDHLLVLLAHRIALDQAQFGRVFTEVFTAYHRAIAGNAPDRAPAPVQYAEFIDWQVALRAQPALEQRIASGRERLARAEPLALPYDRVPPAVRSVKTHVANVEVPRALDAFARGESTTAFGVLLATYQAFLAQITSHTNIPVGLPLNGVNKVSRAFGTIIGDLTDLVLVAGRVELDAPFRDLVRSTRVLVRTAYDDSEIPTSWVVGNNDVYDHPLARAVLNVAPSRRPTHNGTGLEITWRATPQPPLLRKHDLLWWVVEQTGMSLLVGAADVFDPDTIQRLARRLSAMLGAAIAAPETVVSALGAAPAAPRFVAPRTATEHAVAHIWSNVLAVDRISVNDNFLELGGQSVSAMRIVARVEDELAIELPLRAVFEDPTIAALAERIDTLAGSGVASADQRTTDALAALVDRLSDAEVTTQLAEWSRDPPAAGVGGARRALLDHLIAQHVVDAHVTQPLIARGLARAPASWSQQIAWAFHQRGNCSAIGNLAAAFAVRGALDVAALERAFAGLVQRHAALRTVFSVEHGRLVQTVVDRGPALEIVELTGIPHDQRRSHVNEMFSAIRTPHDLRREVLRAQLLRFADDDHVLLFAPNHIVCDGVSQHVIDVDLTALYRACATGQDPTLPRLAFQFNDFSFWQTTLEARPLGRRQLAFWAETVAGYEALELPSERPQPARGAVGLALDSYDTAGVPVVLDGELWQAIDRARVQLGCTAYSLLATAMFVLLARWSGRSDVCIMTGNFHRNRRGSEAIVGNFNTPYPLRARIDQHSTLAAAVRSVHDAALASREHAGVAPSSTVASYPEWTRYNFNYLIDTSDPVPSGSGRLTLERLSLGTLGRRPNDLALVVRQRAAGATGFLAYNAERFSPEHATRIAARLRELLELIASSPTTRIRELPRTP